MIYDDDDGDGQVDGDSSGMVNFQPNTAQPWLRAPQPPWHLWGSTQTVDLRIDPPLVANQATFTHQLAKISYGRPETWHWIFAANVISADPADVGQDLILDIQWDLTIGVGRSSTRFENFDRWFLIWTAGIFPASLRTLWAQRTVRAGIPRTPVVPTVYPDEIIDRVTAQDIQLNAVVRLGESGALSPKSARVEVGAFFAPSTHVRPDWFAVGPPEIKFGGAEIQGK
jgi:hypothetical protein